MAPRNYRNYIDKELKGLGFENYQQMLLTQEVRGDFQFLQMEEEIPRSLTNINQTVSIQIKIAYNSFEDALEIHAFGIWLKQQAPDKEPAKSVILQSEEFTRCDDFPSKQEMINHVLTAETKRVELLNKAKDFTSKLSNVHRSFRKVK